MQSKQSQGSGGSINQTEQGKQELIENKTICPKEIINCQCETNRKINLSFVKNKINGES